MGIDDDDEVVVCAFGLLVHLVEDEVLHERGLTHASACDVEVVSAHQVVGEVDIPLPSCVGIAGMSDARA